MTTKVSQQRVSDQRPFCDSATLDLLYNEMGLTFAEIGSLYGVSRQRVHQKFKDYRLQRRRPRIYHATPHFANLEDYLLRSSSRDGASIRKYLDKIMCQLCGSQKNLHIHHLRYPAKTAADLQVLCACCHRAVHQKGLTIMAQRDICKQYIQGSSARDLASNFNVSRGRIYQILCDFGITSHRKSRVIRRRLYHRTPKTLEG